MFNDSYILKNDKDERINITETGIAWSSDIMYKFKNIENPPDGKKWEDVQWQDMTNGKLKNLSYFYLNFFLFSFRALYRLDENGWSPQLQKALGQNQWSTQTRKVQGLHQQPVRSVTLPRSEVLCAFDDECTGRQELLLSCLLYCGWHSLHAFRFHFLHCLYEKEK